LAEIGQFLRRLARPRIVSNVAHQQAIQSNREGRPNLDVLTKGASFPAAPAGIVVV